MFDDPEIVGMLKILKLSWNCISSEVTRSQNVDAYWDVTK